MSLLGDLGRATMFTQGLSAIGKALSLTGGIAGTVTTESTNALRNMFRVGEKVYDYGDDVLRLSAKSPATFDSLYGKIDATLNVADDAENVVYRVVAKGRNPLDMSGSAGRFNTEGTKVLYTSEDLNTAIAEGTQYMQVGTEYEVYKITTKSLGKTLSMTSELPVQNELLTQGFGDAFARTDYLQGLFVPSKLGGEGNNLLLKSIDDIENFIKVGEDIVR